MNILALDLGVSFGYAHRGGSGTIKLKKGKSKVGGAPDPRYAEFQDWLIGALRLYEIQHVVFENVRHHSGTLASHMWGGWHAILHIECHAFGITLEGITVQDIKQRATGKGNASKNEMMAAALNRLGKKVINDDEADALWLYDFATREVSINAKAV